MKTSPYLPACTVAAQTIGAAAATGGISLIAAVVPSLACVQKLMEAHGLKESAAQLSAVQDSAKQTVVNIPNRPTTLLQIEPTPTKKGWSSKP
jgi:hypothetical protein